MRNRNEAAQLLSAAQGEVRMAADVANGREADTILQEAQDTGELWSAQSVNWCACNDGWWPDIFDAVQAHQQEHLQRHKMKSGWQQTTPFCRKHSSLVSSDLQDM